MEAGKGLGGAPGPLKTKQLPNAGFFRLFWGDVGLMLGVVGGWDGSVRGFEALATKRGEGFGVPMLPNHGYVGLFSVSGWWFGTCEFLKLLAMMINLD